MPTPTPTADEPLPEVIASGNREIVKSLDAMSMELGANTVRFASEINAQARQQNSPARRAAMAQEQTAKTSNSILSILGQQLDMMRRGGPTVVGL